MKKFRNEKYGDEYKSAMKKCKFAILPRKILLLLQNFSKILRHWNIADNWMEIMRKVGKLWEIWILSGNSAETNKKVFAVEKQIQFKNKALFKNKLRKKS